jgi:hypothetical protein
MKRPDKGILSRRSTPMNADQPILFNPRLSVFIGGQPCFGFSQQPLKHAPPGPELCSAAPIAKPLGLSFHLLPAII